MMKRDMDLARDILFKLEDKNNPMEALKYRREGYSDVEVSYHIKLLNEAGLIHAIDASSAAGLTWFAMHLTWEGHEFIELARSDSGWQKSLATAKEKAGGLSFDLIKRLLFKVAEAAIFGGT